MSLEPCNACEALIEISRLEHNINVLNTRFTIAVVLILILFVLIFGWIKHIEKHLRQTK